MIITRIDVTLPSSTEARAKDAALAAFKSVQDWMEGALVARARSLALGDDEAVCSACGRLRSTADASDTRRVRVVLRLGEPGLAALQYLSTDHHAGNRSRATEDAILHALG